MKHEEKDCHKLQHIHNIAAGKVSKPKGKRSGRSGGQQNAAASTVARVAKDNGDRQERMFNRMMDVMEKQQGVNNTEAES